MARGIVIFGPGADTAGVIHALSTLLRNAAVVFPQPVPHHDHTTTRRKVQGAALATHLLVAATRVRHAVTFGTGSKHDEWWLSDGHLHLDPLLSMPAHLMAGRIDLTDVVAVTQVVAAFDGLLPPPLRCPECCFYLRIDDAAVCQAQHHSDLSLGDAAIMLKAAAANDPACVWPGTRVEHVTLSGAEQPSVLAVLIARHVGLL